MKKDKMKPKISDDFIVSFPPELDEKELSTIGAKVNAIIKAPLFLNISDVDDFFLNFWNQLTDVVPHVDGLLLFTFEEERGDYKLNVAGQVDGDAVGIPYSDFFPLKSVKELVKPLILTKGKEQIVDSLLGRFGKGSMAIFPLLVNNSFKGAFIFLSGEDNEFSVLDVKLLWNFSFQGELFLRIMEGSKSLVYYALYDPLTSLFNRRVFNERIDQEVLESRRSGKPFAVLVIDVDEFKDYNDKYHHTFGDLALQEVADILKESVREVDTVARLGGDEFGAILPGTSSNDSLVVAERIIRKITDHTFYDQNYVRTQKMSISVGASIFPLDDFGGQELFKKADSALFTAKKLGGNRIIRNEDLLVMKMGSGPVGKEIQPQSLFEAVRTVFNFDKFMSVLLQISMDSLMADRGSLFVMDPEEAEYILLAKNGFSTNGNKGERIVGGDIIRRVVRQGEPYLSDEDMDEIRAYLKKEGFYNESFISFPLKRNGDVIGIMNFSNKREGGRFDRSDLEKFNPILGSLTGILEEGIQFRKNLSTFGETALTTMFKAFEIKHPFYLGHSSDVADHSVALGRRLGLNEKELDRLKTAAFLHDVGMICVPESIMNKKEPLRENEVHYIRKHPYIGWKILENFPEFEEIRNTVLYHHERIDGSGYPFGLRGKEIPLEASILAIAEFYASITSPRPYRNPLGKEEASNYLKKQADRTFDGSVVNEFINTLH